MPIFYSDLSGKMLFFPVRMISNQEKNQRENRQSGKSYIERIKSLHIYSSSLSKYIPKMKNIKANANPHIIMTNENLPVATGPNTITAKISLLISKRCLEIFRCLRVVSFITNNTMRPLKNLTAETSRYTSG